MDRPSFVKRLSKEFGIATVLSSGKDVYLLLFMRFIRMFAYGASTLILALFFANLGYSDAKIGLFFTLTLVGDIFISLGLTFVADALGRRFILFLGSLLMTAAGACFATMAHYWFLLLAAVFGVISPTGNEIGPFRAIEESTLAQLSDAATRSDIFAWYVVIGTLGAATGSLSCGWFTQSLQNAGWRELSTYKFVFLIYAAIGVLKALLCLCLSRRCEIQADQSSSGAAMNAKENENEEDRPFLESEEPSEEVPATPPAPQKNKSVITRLSRKSTMTLLKLCGLFFFDSLASGMVPMTLIAYFMKSKFGISVGQLGSIMSAAQFMSSIGNIFASSFARRIGLVKAMVFTHLPSAILLALVPAPPSLILTVIILVLRATLASMDQAPRSAFLSAIVLPEERTATMGIVNTVKTMSQSSGPLITGVLAGEGRFWIAFVVAGGLKAAYDLGLLAMFVNTTLEGDKAAVTAAKNRREGEDEGVYTLEDSDSDTELDDLTPKSGMVRHSATEVHP